MEAAVKNALNTQKLQSFGSGGGGCINKGQGYIIDDGSKIFIKFNSKKESRAMFDGEFESLSAIIATDTIKVPRPIVALDNPSGGAVLVTEYLELTSSGKYSSELGDQIARMHLHNESLQKQAAKQESSIHSKPDDTQGYVSQFGFHVNTCCGFIPQDNSWTDDWVEFLCRNKLEHQIGLLKEKANGSDVRTLWGKLLHRIPGFFKNITITPALLHGDLWGGNIDEIQSGPVIFDPASFYGHHEFEMGIATMFGGFNSAFFAAYDKLIPKAPGASSRVKLYQLFHYLNHWNHFGGGYKYSALSIMKDLTL